MKGEGQRHHGRVENPGKIEQIDGSPCDLHPANTNKTYVLLPHGLPSERTRHGKGRPTYQCSTTGNNTTRTYTHARQSAYQHNYLSVMFGEAGISCQQKEPRTSLDQQT